MRRYINCILAFVLPNHTFRGHRVLPNRHFFSWFLLQDADLDILDSDEDEIDEESAVYLESLQDKINKHVNGNMQVSSLGENEDASVAFEPISIAI